MGLFSFDNLQKLWSVWELRSIILFSLFLQFFLVFVSPLRKKTADARTTGLIWLAYLLADWAASFAVGIMSHSQGDTTISKRVSDLRAFWAPFLINHLGGPDTIPAFALEDNELWPRHLLQLLAQLAATGYVFYKSLPNNELLVPTILMFIAGLIKYGEKTNSLYHASVNKFRNSLIKPRDPGPNYAKLVEEYGMRKDARIPVSIELTKEPELELTFKSQGATSDNQNDPEKFQVAFMFFNMFKGQVADVVFRKHEGKKSREYFIARKAEEAFKVVELELNFIYDILYTKMVVVHDRVGYFFRIVSFALVLVSFWLWYSMDKSSLDRHDVEVTYTLLLGAIALDAIAFFMLIFSNWAIARVTRIREIRKNLARRIPSSVLPPGIFHRRWSTTVRLYNVIECCLNMRDQKIERLYERWGLKDFLDGIRYEFRRAHTKRLRNTIFSELKKKAEAMGSPKEAEEIFKARGDWVLVQQQTSTVNKRDFNWKVLIETWITKVEYDESLLIWHIATDLCDNQDKSQEKKVGQQQNNDIPHHENQDAEQQNNGMPHHENQDAEQQNNDMPHHENQDAEQQNNDISHHENQNPQQEIKENREMSKTLSNYMLYLLIRQPKMKTVVAGIGQLRFRDTIAEAEKFFDSLDLNPKCEEEKRRNIACTELLAVDARIPTKEAKGERSKSVLFEGCRLAKELNKLGDHKWMVIHEVWVELLSYAASRCSGNAHAAQLSKVGELFTFVWLLMVHLGLKKQFLINEDDAGARLVV